MDVLFKRIMNLDPTTLLVLFLVVVWLGSRILKSKAVKKISEKLLGIKKIKTAVGEVEFDDDDGERKKEESPHKNCIHSRDVVNTLHKQAESLNDIERIEKHYFRDVRKMARDCLINCTGKMAGIFLRLLKERKGSKKDLVSDPTYKLYDMALEHSRGVILSFIMEMAEENNFVGKKEAGEWSDYKKEKTQAMIDIMRNELNQYYVADIPSREEVYEANMEDLYGKDFNLNLIIDNALDRLLSMSQQATTERDKLIKENQDRISALFGE